MQAVVMGEYGRADVLRLGQFPDPDPRPGWVEVDLAASALNWHDVLVRQGVYSSPLPHVPGADGCGYRRDTNERVMIVPSLFWGSSQSAPARDWEILGDCRPGTYAERVSVPENCVVPAPAKWSVEQCAALPLVGITTYRALFDRARLRAGESLLVLGASGGVATMAVSLATAIGARVVVTSDSPGKIASALEIGAKEGISHTGADWVANARDLTDGQQGFDVVLDPVGRWSESVACLRPGGRCVVLGSSAALNATLEIRPFYFGQYQLIGTTMGSTADMRGLLDLISGHGVRPPVIDRTFPLGEAAEAHRYLETGMAFGKVVLKHG
ncbi:oxidoreductase [Mycobacterium sp. MS1601]|uniref:quinone oxidoreductase family protein n=1 Tax=Mycobacterium sp. MS1601 TaxID=1936029 RepID=UPI0009796444|nr:zinc-binding dehydrogenase [Mycobacterium sp. MS1601]AQA04613.1 oxidoreductase [Mycobacterium sp. MS1601]